MPTTRCITSVSHRMLDIGRIAAVLETDRQAMGQAQHPIRRSQQQRTGVTGDGATVKRRNNRASFSRCKRKQVRVTLCRHRGLLCVDVKHLLQKNFRSLRAPMHLTLVRDVGSSPHFAMATADAKTPAFATAALNACMSGASLCSGMFGMRS